jgi:SAM-dependent methyltransferase
LVRKDLDELIEAYRTALAANGPVPKGLLWPNGADLAIRFGSLLRPIDFDAFSPARRLRLLDLGCGPGLLLDYLACNGLIDKVDYFGVDVFEDTLVHARARWPGQHFERRDVREDPFPEQAFDYCIICGVFTGRFAMPREVMEAMATDTLRAVWPALHLGLGFNVMSKHVDWERDDLFHWPLDDIMAFCKANLSRHVTLHLDYGLWETSVVVRKEPVRLAGLAPPQWPAP